eukprot:GHVU01041907.1.p1 GENE.GHVU01041907.1~~GHVU01041907.1.p1  ORF type:complete len:262 (+),score=21.97 GHVU01041907.1:192-977(+)
MTPTGIGACNGAMPLDAATDPAAVYEGVEDPKSLREKKTLTARNYLPETAKIVKPQPRLFEAPIEVKTTLPSEQLYAPVQRVREPKKIDREKGEQPKTRKRRVPTTEAVLFLEGGDEIPPVETPAPRDARDTGAPQVPTTPQAPIPKNKAPESEPQVPSVAPTHPANAAKAEHKDRVVELRDDKRPRDSSQAQAATQASIPVGEAKPQVPLATAAPTAVVNTGEPDRVLELRDAGGAGASSQAQPAAAPTAVVIQGNQIVS